MKEAIAERVISLEGLEREDEEGGPLSEEEGIRESVCEKERGYSAIQVQIFVKYLLLFIIKILVN